jgi:signal transduction histidine kinase
LVIARSIARLHLGDLTLESSLGVGTTARFYIEGLQEGPSEAYQARLAARTPVTR